MNSGVLLLRNNEWTRDFMNEMMRYGTQPVNFTLEDVSPLLVRLLPPHSNFLTFLLSDSACVVLHDHELWLCRSSVPACLRMR